MKDKRMSAWMECWNRAETALKAVKRDEIRNADTALAVSAFEGLLSSALKTHPPGPWSGLIEQQKFFARLYHE